MLFIRLHAFVATLCFLIASPLIASSDYFDVRIDNIQFGELHFEHNYFAAEYDVDFEFRTKGLAGAIFDLMLEGKAEGIGTQYRRYQPSQAQLMTQYQRNINTMELVFENDMITERVFEPKVDFEIDPRTQPGAIDPVTALSYVFRHNVYESMCRLSIPIFDGVRTSRLTLSRPERRKDGRILCRGEFRRELGYQDETIEEDPSIYFSILFRLGKNSEYYPDRLLSNTIYGQVEIINRASGTQF